MGYEETAAFELKAGDRFKYDGEDYTALEDPRGEFSTTIKVKRTRDDKDMPIYIRDHERVQKITDGAE